MKKILLIDDNEMFRFAFVEWLKTEGFYPITAEDGVEGIRLAQSHHPDLIFCDVNMPLLNGIEVLKQLRHHLDAFQIPFFFLTSEVNLTSRAMQQLGASGVITKGAGISELRQALTAIEV